MLPTLVRRPTRFGGFLVGLTVLATTTAPATAQQTTNTAAHGRAVALEDFYRVRSVGAPRISPDGRWVAYAVTSRVEATNAEPGEIWLASTDGAQTARRVSRADMNASAPQWSGALLEFRSGGRQWRVNPAVPDSLSVAPADDAAPRGERRLPAPVGGRLALLRDMPPAIAPVLARTDFEKRHDARFKGVQFDWLNFQADGQRAPIPDRTNPFVAPVQELFLVDGAREQQLTRLGLRPEDVQWNGAGTRLVFTADSGYRDERHYDASQVFTVGLDGSARMLTRDPEVDHSGAIFSPDGRSVLYTRRLSTNAVIARKLTHGGATDLAIVPTDGGAERMLTADWDYLPTNAAWSPDGRFVYFMGGVGGTTHLFRVPASGGPVQQVTTGERRIASVSFDRAFATMTYTVSSIEAPSDVYVARIDGSNERRVSNVNADLVREVAFSRAERLQFTSADGTPIEGWLMYPHGYRTDGTKYPLVLSNHGGPHSADGYTFDFKSQYFAANGYFVLKVNFRSSTGYGEKFLWGTWGAWGDKDGQDVMAGVDYAIARYPIDRAQVATVGHSYGGFMSNWLITQYPDRFAAAIPGAGIVNWVSDYGTADIARTKETEFLGTPWETRARDIMIRQSPLTYANRVRTPTLFIHGEIDERVPFSEAEQMFVALKKNGVPAKIIRYEGMPHSISGSWNQIHRMMNEREWLDRWLKRKSVS